MPHLEEYIHTVVTHILPGVQSECHKRALTDAALALDPSAAVSAELIINILDVYSS